MAELAPNLGRPTGVNPAALSLAEAARLLRAAGGQRVDVEMLEADVAAGAPTNGVHQRAAGQLYNGKQTHIGWTAKEIVLPTMPGSRASGAIIRVAGIIGRIRGMKHKRVDGTSVRPSLVLIDDPQTDESAAVPASAPRASASWPVPFSAWPDWPGRPTDRAGRHTAARGANGAYRGGRRRPW